MMMKKVWNCSYCSTSVFKGSKVCHQNDPINIIKATTFSSVSHNPNKDIHSNKVDAPFVTHEPKITRQISAEDPDDESHHNYNNKQGHSMTEEATNYVAKKAKRGTRGAVETAFNVGMNVAEGMEQTFGAIKDTTRKVKNTVLGEYDDEGVTNNNNNNDGNGKVDKHVEDLRRKAGGYDRRPH